VESSGKSRIEDRNRSELPVVQLYMRVVVVLQVSCPYHPARRVIRPARRPRSEIANHPWLVHMAHVVYLAVVDGCLAILSMVEVIVIGDSLIDWRFYSLDMLPVTTRADVNTVSGRVSGWLYDLWPLRQEALACKIGLSGSRADVNISGKPLSHGALVVAGPQRCSMMLLWPSLKRDVLGKHTERFDYIPEHEFPHFCRFKHT
jgi:hypothetical protein